MNTWAGLMAKLLLKDGAVPILPGCVEELEAWVVRNILSVSYLCLFCVSNQKERSAEARTGEMGRRKLHRPFWENAENRRKTVGVSHSFIKIYRLCRSVSCVRLLYRSPRSNPKTRKGVKYDLIKVVFWKTVQNNSVSVIHRHEYKSSSERIQKKNIAYKPAHKCCLFFSRKKRTIIEKNTKLNRKI